MLHRDIASQGAALAAASSGTQSADLPSHLWTAHHYAPALGCVGKSGATPQAAYVAYDVDLGDGA